MSAVAVPAKETERRAEVADRGGRAPSGRRPATYVVRSARPGRGARSFPAGEAQVVNLAVERERRSRVHVPVADGLDAAINRHPAGRAASAVGREALPTSKGERLPDAVPSPHSLQGVPTPRAVAAQKLRDAPSSVRGGALLRLISWTVVTIFVLAAALGLGLALRPETYSGQTWEHTVASGESLWGLAAALESGRPLEEVVEDIRSLNGLGEATLYVGQVVTLPAE